MGLTSLKHTLETLRKEMSIGTKETAMDELNELEKELREILPRASHDTKYFAWEIIEALLK